MFAQKDPTSPTDSSGTTSRSGRKTPTSSTSASRPVPIARIFMRGSSFPSMIRTSEVTPRYGSYQESKSRAFKGASGSPFGGGMSRTIRSRSSSMPMPIFAEVRTASSAGIPTTCSICSRARSGSAEGRSILLMTGTITRLLWIAR